MKNKEKERLKLQAYSAFARLLDSYNARLAPKEKTEKTREEVWRIIDDREFILNLIDRQPTEQEAQIAVGMVEMLMGVCKTISECKKCPDKQCSKMLKIIKRTFGIKADG